MPSSNDSRGRSPDSDSSDSVRGGRRRSYSRSRSRSRRHDRRRRSDSPPSSGSSRRSRSYSNDRNGGGRYHNQRSGTGNKRPRSPPSHYHHHHNDDGAYQAGSSGFSGNLAAQFGIGTRGGNNSQSNGGGGGGSGNGGGGGTNALFGFGVEPPIPHNAPRIEVPTLPTQLTSFLDLVATFVSQGGPAVEDEVKIREAHNPYFGFLHADHRDPAHVYYRWRLYSLLQGDTLTQWRTAPFQMEGGTAETFVWVPPPMPVAAGELELLHGGVAPPPLFATLKAPVPTVGEPIDASNSNANGAPSITASTPPPAASDAAATAGSTHRPATMSDVIAAKKLKMHALSNLRDGAKALRSVSDEAVRLGEEMGSVMMAAPPPQRHNDDDTSPDGLGCTREEAAVLAHIFNTLGGAPTSSNGSDAATATTAAAGDIIRKDHLPLVAYLPTPPLPICQPAPFLSAAGGTSSASSSASRPSSEWLARLLTQREQAHFAFMNNMDAAALSGKVPIGALVSAEAAAAAGGNNATNSVSSAPAATGGNSNSCGITATTPTANINQLGRVRAAAALLLLRKAKKEGTNSGDAANSSSRLLPVDVCMKNINHLLGTTAGGNGAATAPPPPPPSFDDDTAVNTNTTSDETTTTTINTKRIAALRDTLRARCQQAYGCHPPDLVNYAMSAYGYLFAADDQEDMLKVKEGDDAYSTSSSTTFHTKLLQPTLLSKAFISEVTLFALQRHRAAYHVASLLLDELSAMATLPTDAMGLCDYLSGPQMLGSAEAAELASLLDAGSDVSSNASAQHGRATLLQYLSSIPHRIVTTHTYAIQSLLFILNDIVLGCGAAYGGGGGGAGHQQQGAAGGGASAGSNTPNAGNNNNATAQQQQHQQAPAAIPLSEVAATASSHPGPVVAEVLAKIPPPPQSAGAVPTPAAMALAARNHNLAVQQSIADLGNPSKRYPAAINMIMPSVVDVVGAYAVAVVTLAGRGGGVAAADQTANNHSAAAHVSTLQGSIALPSAASANSTTNDASSALQAIDNAFMATQLIAWLKTMVDEWQTADVMSTRKYNALLARYEFLAL